MNIVGLMVSKVILLVAVLFSPTNASEKLMLVTIWLVKSIIDYDIAKPGHGGRIYSWTKRFKFEIRELIVAFIQCIPSVIFVVVAIIMRARILLILGIIGVTISFFSVILCIKDIIIEKKRRREKIRAK